MKKRSPRRQVANIPSSHWLAYAAAGAATAFATSNSAEAEIHYSGRVEVKFPPNESTAKTFQLDQPGDFFRLTHYGGSFYRAFFEITGIQSAGFRGFVLGGVGVYLVSKLSFGQNISEGNFVSAPFTFSMPGILASAFYGLWSDRGVSFVGFKFGSGTGVRYGWARIKMTGEKGKDGFKLLDYAYGDPGEPVRAGQRTSDTAQVPTFNSLGLLAIGASGLGSGAALEATLRIRRTAMWYNTGTVVVQQDKQLTLTPSSVQNSDCVTL